MSIRVIRMLLPRNSNLVTAQAAATPNTRFSGTEMAVASRVSFSAEMASGSLIACQNTSRPRLRPWVTTMYSGNTRIAANTAQAMTIRMMAPTERLAGRAAALWPRVARLMTGSSELRLDAALQDVDQQQQDERHHQHDHADGGGARVVVLIQLGDDQQRQHLGLQRDVAGDEHHRAVLADTTRKGQG